MLVLGFELKEQKVHLRRHVGILRLPIIGVVDFDHVPFIVPKLRHPRAPVIPYRRARSLIGGHPCLCFVFPGRPMLVVV